MGSWPSIFYFLIPYGGKSGFHGAAFENQTQITSARCDVLIRGLEKVI